MHTLYCIASYREAECVERVSYSMCEMIQLIKGKLDDMLQPCSKNHLSKSSVHVNQNSRSKLTDDLNVVVFFRRMANQDHVYQNQW